MATQKINLTRDQLATFLKNQEQIKQFEKLFEIADEVAPSSDTTGISIQAGTAQATANDALAQIVTLAQSSAINSSTADQKAVQALAQIATLAQDAAINSGNADQKAIQALDEISLIKNYIKILARPLRTEVSSPAASGFSISLVSVFSGIVQNIWLLLTPTSGFATGTIVLPSSTTCKDQQFVTVSCTQQVNALTVDGNGASVFGAPSALAADSIFKLMYNAASNNWHLNQ
jgi:hypothetical protein